MTIQYLRLLSKFAAQGYGVCSCKSKNFFENIAKFAYFLIIFSSFFYEICLLEFYRKYKAKIILFNLSLKLFILKNNIVNNVIWQNCKLQVFCKNKLIPKSLLSDSFKSHRISI